MTSKEDIRVPNDCFCCRCKKVTEDTVAAVIGGMNACPENAEIAESSFKIIQNIITIILTINMSK